jgi:hypothetical protein
MRYVTREHIHVDRIATAWAIRRFVDPEATFGFVARSHELRGNEGIAFDVRGAELGHRRGRCTLDALIAKHEIADEPLRRMARIVRGADLPHDDGAPPESPGVLAVFTGIRDGSATDAQRLERGSVVCDALYAYCAATADAGSSLT